MSLGRRIMMKHGLLIAVMISVFAITGVSQSGKSKSINEDLEIEVMATIQLWADAVTNRNLKALDAIFSPDLIITTYDGHTRGKAEELEAFKPNPDVKTLSVANENVRVRFYGKTAVVTALTKMGFNVKGKEVKVELLYTAVFVKEVGRWQMVALQTARAPQPPAAKSD